MVGGAIFNLANLLLVAAIDMAGLAVASSGFDWNRASSRRRAELHPATQRQSRYSLLLGVVCALIAVILDGKAFGSLGSRADRRRERASSSALSPEC